MSYDWKSVRRPRDDVLCVSLNILSFIDDDVMFSGNKADEQHKPVDVLILSTITNVAICVTTHNVTFSGVNQFETNRLSLVAWQTTLWPMTWMKSMNRGNCYLLWRTHRWSRWNEFGSRASAKRLQPIGDPTDDARTHSEASDRFHLDYTRYHIVLSISKVVPNGSGFKEG